MRGLSFLNGYWYQYQYRYCYQYWYQYRYRHRYKYRFRYQYQHWYQYLYQYHSICIDIGIGIGISIGISIGIGIGTIIGPTHLSQRPGLRGLKHVYFKFCTTEPTLCHILKTYSWIKKSVLSVCSKFPWFIKLRQQV